MEMRKARPTFVLTFILASLMIINLFLFSFFFSPIQKNHLIKLGNGITQSKDIVWIPDARLTMRSDRESMTQNEKSIHKVRSNEFWIERAHALTSSENK